MVMLNNEMIERKEGFSYNIVYNHIYNKEIIKKEFEGFCAERPTNDDFKKELMRRGYKNIEIISLIITPKIQFILNVDGCIFESKEEGLKYIEDRNKLNLSNIEFHKKQDQTKEEENLKIAKKEKYLRLFLETFKNLMQKGKAKKTLYKLINYNNEGIFERFVYMENIKDNCYKLAYEEEVYYNKDLERVKKWRYRVYLSENTLRNITKTEYDYLNFLRGLI